MDTILGYATDIENDFRQIGPTCGFFCMEKACALLNSFSTDEKRTLEYVRKEINDKNCRVGEIFEPDQFKFLFEKNYPGHTIKQCELIDNKVDAERIVNIIAHGDMVILPITYKITPHYIVLCGIENGKVMYYDPAKPRYMKRSIDKLLGMNSNIRCSYCWKNFYGNKKTQNEFLEKILQLDNKDTRTLYKKTHFSRKVLYNITSEVSLKGVYFVIGQRKPHPKG